MRRQDALRARAGQRITAEVEYDIAVLHGLLLAQRLSHGVMTYDCTHPAHAPVGMDDTNRTIWACMNCGSIAPKL